MNIEKPNFDQGNNFDKKLEETLAQEMVDIQLTPELKERTMEKVQDVNGPDVAGTLIFYEGTQGLRRERESLPKYALLPEVISHVLAEGVLSNTTKGEDPEWGKAEAERWGKRMAGGRRNASEVYFTINDRSLYTGDIARMKAGEPGFQQEKGKFRNHSWEYGQQNAIYAFFDISKYEEIGMSEKYENRKARTFWLNNPPRWAGELSKASKAMYALRPGYKESLSQPAYQELVNNYIIDERGRPYSDKEYGFALRGRIPPRFFQGLAVVHEESYKPNGNAEKDLVTEVVELMLKANEDHPERLIPIYDAEGSLIWPEKMSYDEIREYLAERKKMENETE